MNLIVKILSMTLAIIFVSNASYHWDMGDTMISIIFGILGFINLMIAFGDTPHG